MKLTLPYPPSANDYWRTAVITPPGEHPRAVTYVSEDAKAYKREVLRRNCQLEPLRGPVRFTATVYRPRKVGDLLNRDKVLCDALEGIAYQNDKQIIEAHFYLRDSKDNPRVEVEVEEITGGLF